MKRILNLIIAIVICISFLGCNRESRDNVVVATTLPVYEFTAALCEGTDIAVKRLITEDVSCLHDYTLQVQQMRAIEEADLIVISGAEFETFLTDALDTSVEPVDTSVGIHFLECDHETGHDHEHSHEHDPHIWLSPANAKSMAANICTGLLGKYPQYSDHFNRNLTVLNGKLDKLITYAEQQLSQLSCRDIITFHDGFGYMAEAFDLSIISTLEEESGSEASAAELIELIELVRTHKLPAIFTERNGSASAASIISSETGAEIYALDMAVSGNSYFEAMYHNIDTLKEALE